MSLEQQVAALVTSTNELTQAVAGKVAQIDAAVEGAKAALETQLASRSFTLRNRVINGDMRIDQRNSGSPLIDQTNSARIFPVDRFRTNGKVLPTGRFTLQQVGDAPKGFTSSMKVSITAAEAVTAAQIFTIEHPIEAHNIADFSWGSSAAQPATLTFWSKATLPGTYTVAIRSSGLTPEVSFVAAYSIEKANSWERKTIAITPATTGSWNSAAASLGALICWNLGSGSNAIGASGAWSGGAFYRTRGDVNLIETLGASLQITGVQLEKGDVATPFEFRPLGLELSLCQRYYYQSEAFDKGILAFGGARAIATNTSWCYTLSPTPPVPMRAGPTVVIRSAGTRQDNYISDPTNGGVVEVQTAYAGRHYPPQIMTAFALTAGRMYGFDYSLNAEL